MQTYPGWNPLTSAQSGAAFAIFLAAATLSGTVQIAAKDRSVPQLMATSSRLRSLKFAPVTTLQLLAAAYGYIVLAGVNGQIDQLAVQSAFNQNPALLLGYKRMADNGFSVAGTELALGTIFAIFTIVLTVYESTPDEVRRMKSGAESWARSVFYVSVWLVAIILLYGYGNGYVTQNDSTPSTDWIVLHTLLILGPMALASFLRLARIRRRARKWLTDHSWAVDASHSFLCHLLTVLLVVGVPSMVVVMRVSVGPTYFGDHEQLFSYASAAYYTVVASALICFLPGDGAERGSKKQADGARDPGEHTVERRPRPTPLAQEQAA